MVPDFVPESESLAPMLGTMKIVPELRAQEPLVSENTCININWRYTIQLAL